MNQDEVKNIRTALGKKAGEILQAEEVKKVIIKTLQKDFSPSQFYKIMYELKKKDILLSIKKDIFFIKPLKRVLSETDIEDKFYRKILKKHCTTYCGNQRYIGGITALEANYGLPGIPEEIHIYNKKKQAKEILLFQKKINFKTYENAKKNLFTSISPFTHKIHLNGQSLPCANIELAILESLYNLDRENQAYIHNLILKIIKKQQRIFNITILEKILKLGKHNTSLNRLMTLLNANFPNIANEIKKLIKKHGYLLSDF